MRVGDRVRPNDQYRESFPKSKEPGRLGTVMDVSDHVMLVHWDGTKETSRDALHENFLEVVDGVS